MKQTIHDLIENALADLQQSGQLPDDLRIDIQVSATKDRSQGDFASNIAMTLARQADKPPREVAELVVGQLAEHDSIEKVEVAGPGFINFFLASDASHAVIRQILQQGGQFGRSDHGKGKKIQVEFVSANPTGPLHVGHGRGAAYGATLANVLRNAGYEVQCEYYVNDAGRQMDILAASTWLRYLELCGVELTFPSNGYQGDYVWDIAATLHREQGEKFRHEQTEVFNKVCDDAPLGDKERHIDDLIANAQVLLGDDYRVVFDLALDTLVDVIRRDLHAFGVDFDEWFSERSLSDKGLLEASIKQLADNGHIYEKDGALWFRSTVMATLTANGPRNLFITPRRLR